MSRRSKAICAGLGIGLLGLVVSATPFGIAQEENIGLHLLFKLRGARKAPPEVVVVAMESASINHLNLPSNPTKWPRSLHAHIIDTLVEQKAAVIAFDIFFSEARSPQDDDQFAQAIQSAGNVVLIEKLKKVPLFKPTGTLMGNVELEERVPPTSLIAQSALASAPFPLPKIPVKLNSYWTFKTSAGDAPTLPVVVFQVFALQVYDELIGLLRRVESSYAEMLPVTKDEIFADKRIKELMFLLKNFFEQNPMAAEEMLATLEASDILVTEANKRQILKSLIRLYQGPNSHYLNLYGPPRTISTVPYYQLLENDESPETDSGRFNLRDKVVFIGLSEGLRPEEDEGFHTVFSQSSGVDISGVEIAATAFANILEDMPVQPFKLQTQRFGVFIWGTVLGILCVSLSTSMAAVCVLVLSLAYLFFAYSQFIQIGIWYPVVVPVFLQSPLIFVGTTIWKYFEVNRERQNIRTAFEFYLPNDVVDQLAKNLSSIQTSRKLVYGTCLFTDAEKYTSFSEALDPEKLSSYTNKYFEVIFEPMRKNSGIILEVKGDSVLAVWTKAHPNGSLRNLACHTALDIALALDEFNRSCSSSPLLRTRIGIHYGDFCLSHIGAINRYQYQPVGDSVNTASRIEGLNKHLGTQILISEEVLDQLDDFLVRRMGRFILAGKSEPVTVYELICRMHESTASQRDFCKTFTQALDSYQRQSWNEAIAGFNESLKMLSKNGKDKPSADYLKLCRKFKISPPSDTWDGVVRLHTK